MDNRFRGILDELSGSSPYEDQSLFLENRAIQLIVSFKNLSALIDSKYDEEIAEDLKRRLLLSARSGDPKKFTRKLAELRKEENGR